MAITYDTCTSIDSLALHFLPVAVVAFSQFPTRHASDYSNNKQDHETFIENAL